MWTLLWSCAAIVWLFLCGAINPAHCNIVRYLDAVAGADSPDCLADGSPSNACQSLLFALTTDSNNLTLSILPGTYYYGDGELRVRNSSNVLVQKAPGYMGEVIFRCSAPLTNSNATFNNLAFLNGDNITVQGITVEECGPKESGIFVRYCNGIYFKDCIFRNNTGPGLWTSRCSEVEIQNCLFIDNAAFNIDLEFDLLAFAPGGLSVILRNNIGSSVIISNCSFINNTATLKEQENRPRGYTPSAVGDGGAILIRFSNTTNSRVEIINCTFTNNTADDIGGAVYIPMIEGSENNSLIISNSMFENSQARVSGGAVAVDLFDVGDGNFVEFIETTFSGNEADVSGGGMSFVLEDSSPQTSTSTDGTIELIVAFTGCVFEGNRSPRGGAALGLISNARVDQPAMTAVFTNCTFARNVAERESALFAFRFPTVFEGNNVFEKNRGGGLTVINSRLHSRGDLLFAENTAREGAGLTLVEQSLVNLVTGTTITFRGNRADSVGGALLARNPSVGVDIRTNSLYNHLCFIQYEVEKENTQTLTPSEWKNVTVKFFSNTASHAGAAIYASDLSRCLFTSRDCPLDNITELNEYQKSIFQEDPFIFDSNTVLDTKLNISVHRIATEPSRLDVMADHSTSAPGDVVRYTVRAWDQAGNPRGGVWRFEDDIDALEDLADSQLFEYFSIPAGPKTHDEVFRVTAYDEVLCSNSSQQGHAQLEFFIIQAVTGDVVFETPVEINITCCHPGFYYDSANKTCRFGNGEPNVLRADNNHRHVYIQPGYYAGFYDDPFTDEKYFTTVLAPSAFLNCTQEGSRTGCLYVDGQPDDQCVDNRKGYMCGECPTGYGIDLTLTDCKKCTAGDAVGLVVICILVVIFCIVVLAFNIGVPNDLKGFLFYAQVVGFVYLHGAEGFTWDFHLSRLFGFSLYLPICPFTALPALWTVAIGWLPPILAIITVVTYIICARFIRSLSTRTVFDGLWFIFLYVYKFLADTTSNVVKCVKVEGNAIEEKGYFRLAFYYDGNVPCFAGEHWILAFPSLLLLVAVILGPVFVVVISFKRFKRTQPFTDVITEGITRRCRWWAGFDLFRRLMFIAVVTIFDFAEPDYTQLALCFTTLVVLAVLCATKPYEVFWVNVVEGLILLDLLLIALHFLNERDFRREPSDHTNLIILLLLLPFLYLAANIAIRISIRLWKKYVPMDPLKMKYWVPTLPNSTVLADKSKPLLLLSGPSTTTDTIGSSSSKLNSGGQSSGPHGNIEETSFQDEGGEDTDYSALREELLDDL